MNGTENTYKIESTSYTFDEIYDFNFKVLVDSDHYVMDGDKIKELDANDANDMAILNQRLEEAIDLKIVGILRPTDDSMAMANIGTIGYMADLEDFAIEKCNKSEVVKAQLNNRDVDLFTGIRFTWQGPLIYFFKSLARAVAPSKVSFLPAINVYSKEILLPVLSK